MSRDEKIKKVIDEFKQKIEKLCKEYGVNRARASKIIYKPKIDEGKLRKILEDNCPEREQTLSYSILTHAIAEKAEEIIK